MVKKQLKRAGFWVRFLTRVIDFVVIATISTIVAWANLANKPIRFPNPYNFYLWSFITILWTFIIFVFLPVITNGKTIGMYLTKTKIVFDTKNKWKSILKREALFGLTWMFNLLLVMVVINHTLINQYAKTDQNNINYSTFEVFRTSIISSVGGILLLLQFIVALSVIVRGNRGGLHDGFSQTKTVWINKYVDVPNKVKLIKSFKPHVVETREIIWIGE